MNLKSKVIVALTLFVSLVFVGCNTNSPSDTEQATESTKDTLKTQSLKVDSVQQDDFLPEVDKCGKRSVSEFYHYFGLDYGDEEKLLTAKIGSFTNGNYSRDSLYFIYHYNQVDRVPVEVWIQTETGKIITIFLEVLSFDETFKKDVSKAQKTFPMTKCEVSWLGLTADEIIAKLGQPAEDAVSREGIRLLTYDSFDFKIAVAFKIYPQENKCSSISVNWFYDDK